VNLAPIAERLKDQVPALRAVDGAAELAGAMERLRNPPEAFVLLLAEDAGENLFGDLAVVQMVTARFGVVQIVRNLAGAGGGAAAEELRQIRLAVRDALVGWQHPDGERTTTFRRGRLVSFNDQLLSWQDEFETEFQIRKT